MQSLNLVNHHPGSVLGYSPQRLIIEHRPEPPHKELHCGGHLDRGSKLVVLGRFSPRSTQSKRPLEKCVQLQRHRKPNFTHPHLRWPLNFSPKMPAALYATSMNRYLTYEAIIPKTPARRKWRAEFPRIVIKQHSVFLKNSIRVSRSTLKLSLG